MVKGINFFVYVAAFVIVGALVSYISGSDTIALACGIIAGFVADVILSCVRISLFRSVQ